MFPHNNSSTLHSHGSYSVYHPYPQSRHQPNSNYPSHSSSLQEPLSFQHGSSDSHVPSLRSASLYSLYEQPSLPLSQSHICGDGYQSSHSGYWNDRASGSPHTGGSGYLLTSSTATTTPAFSSHWSSSVLAPTPSHFPSYNGAREQSYTMIALPTVNPFSPTLRLSPGMLQLQPPLTPLGSVGSGGSSDGGSCRLSCRSCELYCRSASARPTNHTTVNQTRFIRLQTQCI
jgi:hypothetical protein